MSYVFTRSTDEIKAAKWPHELFLMNLVYFYNSSRSSQVFAGFDRHHSFAFNFHH
jgi:hypothetical protein